MEHLEEYFCINVDTNVTPPDFRVTKTKYTILISICSLSG